MRNGPAFRIAAFLTAVTVIVACAPKEDAMSDSAAAAAAAAPPPAESFSLMAKDGRWSGEITPAGVVFRHRANDSLTFPFSAPTVNGSINEYSFLVTGTDTVRLTVTTTGAPCTDNKGVSHTHIAQVWLSGKAKGRDVALEAQGCASKRM
jgi:hypothetical protein